LQAFKDENPTPHNPRLYSYRNLSSSLLRASLNQEMENKFSLDQKNKFTEEMEKSYKINHVL